MISMFQNKAEQCQYRPAMASKALMGIPFAQSLQQTLHSLK